MGRSVVDIRNAGTALQTIVNNLSIDSKRAVAEEMQGMALYRFPQAVYRFYPSVLRVRTGRLRQSFEGFGDRLGENSWRIGMRSRHVNYATIQHDGGQTAPHTILPKNKKALYWEGAAHPVRRVNHPGSTIRATKFFEEPMSDEIEPMLRRIRDAIGFRK